MKTSTKTPQSVLALGRELDIKTILLRFTDLLGRWRWIAIPSGELTEERFEDGFGSDAGGHALWQGGPATDLLLMPQPETAFLDPFAEIPSLNLLCSAHDPLAGDAFHLDPRSVAAKAVSYLSGVGLADRALCGTESYFFIFDDVRYESRPLHSYVELRPCGSSDDLLGEVIQTLLACGLPVESLRPSSARGDQFAVSLRPEELVRAGDALMIMKYVIKGVARKFGKSVTFMPRPVASRPGSGLHAQLSLWKGADPVFAGAAYAGLSDAALGAIGGLLRHAPAMAAWTNASTNSYKRVGPHGGADDGIPWTLTYSQRNPRSAVRVSTYSQSPRSKQIEYRLPDASGNPYLALGAILMAAIDGVQNKIDPQQSLEDQASDEGHPSQSLRTAGAGDGAPDAFPQPPATLRDALAALQRDGEFLLQGDVFSRELIESWVECKRTLEIPRLQGVPEVGEFDLYYDV